MYRSKQDQEEIDNYYTGIIDSSAERAYNTSLLYDAKRNAQDVMQTEAKNPQREKATKSVATQTPCSGKSL